MSDNREWTGRLTQKWEPIETAPTDGTKIWLYGWRPHGGSASAESLIGSYEAGYTHGWECERGSEFYATHWMPLPEPPA